MIHLLIGVQGSGKTTFAKALKEKNNAKIISTDQIRKDYKGIKEEDVWIKVYDELADCVRNNIDAIFDSTSITKNVRKRFFDQMEMRGVKPIAIAYFIDTDVNECYRRVKKRNEDKNELYLPPEVIMSYYEKMEAVSLDEGFIKIYHVINGEIREE